MLFRLQWMEQPWQWLKLPLTQNAKCAIANLLSIGWAIAGESMREISARQLLRDIPFLLTKRWI